MWPAAGRVYRAINRARWANASPSVVNYPIPGLDARRATPQPAALRGFAMVSAPVQSSRSIRLVDRRLARAANCPKYPRFATAREPASRPSWSTVHPIFALKAHATARAPRTLIARLAMPAFRRKSGASPPVPALERRRTVSPARMPANATRASAWTATAARAVVRARAEAAVCPDRSGSV